MPNEYGAKVPMKAGKLRRMMRFLFRLFLVLAVVIGGWFLWRYHPPTASVEIYQGLTYGCDRLPSGPETGGLMHWVRADLKVPGVQIFVTPVDADAHQHGYEYKLKYTSTAVKDEHLAVAVNGTLFSSKSWFIRLPGDYATAVETVVADHAVNHVFKDCYLLWWGDDMIAHQEYTKPPTGEDLFHARWGIAGQQATFVNGVALSPSGKEPDRRTMIAADPVNKYVWIACFDKASYRTAAEALAAKGAKFGTMVDGGTSVAMAIGDQAKNVRTGTVTGNWRPVATVFGFRANPLP